MRVPTVSLDEEGCTYFRDTELPFEAADFTPPSPTGYWITPTLGAKGVSIMRTPGGYIDEWHPAPYHVLTAVMRGSLRLETSDGDHRIMETGNIFINEDLEGRGHRLTEVNGEAYDILLVRLS